MFYSFNLRKRKDGRAGPVGLCPLFPRLRAWAAQHPQRLRIEPARGPHRARTGAKPELGRSWAGAGPEVRRAQAVRWKPSGITRGLPARVKPGPLTG